MGTYKETIVLIDKVSEPLKKMQKNLGEVTKKLDKSTKGLTNFSNKGGDSIDKLCSHMKKLESAAGFVGKAFLAAFSIQKIAQVGSYVNKMGNQFQDALVDLETMLGSADKAQNLFKNIQTMAIKTPFETSDLLESTKMLLSFGIAEDKVLKYSKLLGDISGGNKEKFKSLSLNFGQVASLGKLQGQDFRSFTMAGFNPLAELSKMTGKSMNQLQDEMSHGAISFDLLVKAMERATGAGGRFYKLMDKRSQTFSGKMSTMMDSISLWAGTTGMSINSKLLPVLDKIAPAIDTALNKTTPIMLKFTDYFVKMFNSIENNPAIDLLRNQIALLREELKAFVVENPEFVEALKKSFDWFISSGIPNILTSITAVLRGTLKVFSKINDIFKGIGGFIGDIIGRILSIPTDIQTAFTNMSNAILQALMPIIKMIKEAKAALADSVSNAQTLAQTIANNSNRYDNRSYKTINNDNRSYGGHTYNITNNSGMDFSKLNPQYVI